MLKFLEKNKKIITYISLILYWLTLIIATSLPSKDMPNIKLNDKIEHLLAYFILGILFNLSILFQDKIKILKDNAFISSIVLLMIYAILDELHQIFIPGRDSSFIDWSADTIGIILGVLTTYLLVKKITKINWS